MKLTKLLARDYYKSKKKKKKKKKTREKIIVIIDLDPSTRYIHAQKNILRCKRRTIMIFEFKKRAMILTKREKKKEKTRRKD